MFRDLDLYVNRDKKTGEHVLKLGVKLTRKTYTFNLNNNPLFCIITHIISLTFNDEAFVSGIPGFLAEGQLDVVCGIVRSSCCQLP